MAIPIINVSILNGSNGFRLDQPGSLVNGSAASVSSAGDINGDGFDDVMVGFFYPYVNNTGLGSSYVVFGQAAGFGAAINLASLDGSDGFHLDAPGSDSHPFLVSDAGDINGDGFDDVIIGAPGVYDYPRAYDGASYVVFGRASGFAADINLSNLDGSNGFRLDVTGSGEVSVSSAGDVNGDGFDDVIIGARDADPNGIRDAGSSYVVFGKASGFDVTLDLSSLDGTNGFRLDGIATNDQSGRSVSSACDVNGDGFDDVIISAPFAGSDDGFSGPGVSYAVFGRASGFDAALNLSSLDGSNGFRLDGIAVLDQSGYSLSNAGDVNGDGFDDMIIGGPGSDPNGDRSGSSYVVFGKAVGFDATLDLSGLDGSNGFRLDGATEGDAAGFSVSNAGDVNGDGFDDLLVGAHRADPSGGDSGSSYVIFGKASGFAATLNLASLDGNNGFRLDGTARSGFFGSSVSSAGDVNNDGFDDLIVGAFFTGASYVIFGGDFITGEAVYLGTPGDDNLVGTILAERFEAGDGNDRMNGLGGADIFQGDGGDDSISVADLDFQQVDGGTGTDTLELTSGGINLNLADFHGKVDGIETIDLTGSGNNTLILTLPDLLSLSDTTDTFTVNGNAGDRVVGLIDGWTDGGVDGDYRIFTNSGTTLRVHLAVRTEVPMPGVISLADLDGSNGFRMDRAEESGNSGRSISDAGDVNGDGFYDVIVGAPFAGPNNSSSGSSYVVFGKASGFDATLDLSSLDGTNGFRVDGEVRSDRSGESVSSAGDVNGDGFDDVIIGARLANPNDVSEAGSSYVVFGKASGFDAAMDLSSLDGSNGFRLDGTAVGDRSGESVSSAGDVNGDGFDDVIVGASSADPNGNHSGSSYVVFGKASGFNARLDLSSLNGNNGFRVDGEGGESSGFSVGNAGDVNNDGFDDLIIDTPNDSSYVVFGKASGFSATLDLSSLDGNTGFHLEGEKGGDASGRSVSGAGDINGDGFDDVIVGAAYADPNGFMSGTSYVVFGRASGFNATLDLSSLDGSNGFRLDGAEGDKSGFSVSNAGDVNGDGFDDVIVGAYGADSLGSYSEAGSSYVVFGRASGFSAALNLSNLDSNSGIRLDGAAGGDHSGESVSGAGDVNGDGFDDLLVGAPDADVGAPDPDTFVYDSGSSYVIFGRSDFTGGNVIAGTPGDDSLTGTPLAERFEAGDGNDTMIGRGGADVFHGGADDDRTRVSDLSFQLVDGGSGNNDILSLGGGSNNLDLNLADVRGKISGIETIYLHGGSGDKTLTLTAADLLNLSDSSNTLKVNGNAGDHVTVQDSGWADGGIDGDFHTYTNDAAILLVGVNVATDFV